MLKLRVARFKFARVRVRVRVRVRYSIRSMGRQCMYESIKMSI